MKQEVICVYSDESCHLGQANEFMVVGAIWCERSEVRNFTDRVKLLRVKHGISTLWETKWTKISGAKKNYYLDFVRAFFDEEGVNFRAVVIPTKELKHEQYRQTEDEFYYKMQYMMLKNIVAKKSSHERKDFKIFLDYKDSWSDVHSKRLAEFLQNTKVFVGDTFYCQPVRSNESIMIQAADLFTGAVASANNNPQIRMQAKREVIDLIEELSNQKLTGKTPYGVDKFNLFRWHDGAGVRGRGVS